MTYLFEIHLTVNNLHHAQLPIFEQFCQQLDGQAVIIHLPAGEHTQQPMFTMTKTAENLTEVLAFIKELEPHFLTQSFNVIRTKVEIPANQADKFLRQYSDTKGYFEWHGKVDFFTQDNLSLLEKMLENNNAHLSKNALKTSPTQRFITIRYGLENQDKFYQQVACITQKIYQQSKFSLLKSQQELCVFDDKISLDKGWI